MRKVFLLTATMVLVLTSSGVAIDEFDSRPGWTESETRPNRTRLLMLPTARALNAGEAYLMDINFFFPSANIGLTDFINLGGGMSFFPWAPLEEQVKYLTGKVRVLSFDNISLALAGTMYSIPDNDHDYGMGWAVTTLGPITHSLTVGLGYGYYDGELLRLPGIAIGGEVAVARDASLVAEAWFIDRESTYFSGAWRFVGKRLSVDVGWALAVNEYGDGSTMPIFTFMHHF